MSSIFTSSGVSTGGGGGAASLVQVLVIGPTTHTASAGELVLCDLTLGGVEIALPDVHAQGDRIGVKLVSPTTDEVEIEPGAGALIDGASELILERDYDWVTLESNGVDWLRFAPGGDGAANLRVSSSILTGDSMIEPGLVYTVGSAQDPITLTLTVWPDDPPTAGRSFAFYSQTGEGGAGDVIIAVPEGSTIEDDDGQNMATITILQGRARGLMREWLCSDDGLTWKLHHRQESLYATRQPQTFAFTQRATSTDQTSSEVIGSCAFHPADWRDRDIVFLAYLAVMEAGHTAVLELYDVPTGTLLATLSSTQTLAEQQYTWIYPDLATFGTLYELRLKSLGGGRVFCLTAAIEVRG